MALLLLWLVCHSWLESLGHPVCHNTTSCVGFCFDDSIRRPKDYKEPDATQQNINTLKQHLSTTRAASSFITTLLPAVMGA
jgi:hypothetical protein